MRKVLKTIFAILEAPAVFCILWVCVYIPTHWRAIFHPPLHWYYVVSHDVEVEEAFCIDDFGEIYGRVKRVKGQTTYEALSVPASYWSTEFLEMGPAMGAVSNKLWGGCSLGVHIVNIPANAKEPQ